MLTTTRLTQASTLAALALAAPWSFAQSATTITTTTTTTVTHPHVPEPVVIVPQVRRRPAPEATVAVSAVHASIAINEQVSATTLVLSLHNPSTRAQEAQILLPVPDGVLVRSMEYDGPGVKPEANLLPRDEARRIYDSIVASMRDPALVEFAGYNLIRTSAFPIQPGATQKVTLTYEQVLPADGPRVDYLLPRTESLGGPGVTWSVDGTIKSSKPIASLYSPTHELSTTRELSSTGEQGTLRFRLVNSPGSERGAIRLSYLLAGDKPAAPVATLLCYPDAEVSKDGRGGYFLLFAGLPPRQDNAPPAPREVVLVLDRSGSMRGEKLDQAKAAAEQVIQGLSAGDSFNIIDYSDSIESFRSAAIDLDPSSLAQAKSYISGLSAGGGTNIHDALLESLRPAPKDNRLPIVLFLTDGLPTVGERNEVRLRDAVARANTHQRRIFSFGVGYDVNSPLLAHIAKTSRATSVVVQPKDDVEVAVSQVFKRLGGPRLGLPKLAIEADSTARVREMMPRELGDVFEGDQIVVLGQYTTGPDNRLALTLEGQQGAQKVSFPFELSTQRSSVRNSFVPRLWAYAKVADLVDEVRQASADRTIPEARMKEITDEIVRLSTKWGILTEYTAFLATEEARFTRAGLPAAPTTEAINRTLHERAAGDRAGAGGANQTMNLSRMDDTKLGLQSKQNAYVRADMEQVQNTAINQVADKSFYSRNNRWVQAELLGRETETPDRVVEFGTPAYLTLVNDLAAEGRQATLAQGGEVYLLIGKERVLVKSP